MLDKYYQGKCVQELVCRTQIQQQFVAGWRPVGGSELANEWIQLDQKPERLAEKGHKEIMPKSFICKFSQAKLKAIGQRRAKAHSILPHEIETKCDERQSCEPDIPLVQEKDIVDEIKPLPGKSVNDVKGEVSKSQKLPGMDTVSRDHQKQEISSCDE